MEHGEFTIMRCPPPHPKKKKFRRGECGAHGDTLSQEMGAVALSDMSGDLSELVDECMVCSDMKRDTLFGPCGHVTCCSVCAPRVKKCLLCKDPITTRTKVRAASSKSTTISKMLFPYVDRRVRGVLGQKGFRPVPAMRPYVRL